jgi:hypothetical protein
MVLRVNVSPGLIASDVDEGYGKLADELAKRDPTLTCAVRVSNPGA